MFRTAAIRSAAAVAARRSATTATRSFSSVVVSRPALVKTSAVASFSRVASWNAVRGYSSGGAGLVKGDVEARIMGLLSGFDKVNDPNNIKPTAHFANDLGLDSLDTVEVVMAIEEEFSIEIPDKDADTIHSVDKAVEYILSQPDAQ
ncbi:Acyl carrier protein, mitochondrial [Cytospora mali]|uniref:Acyl carrier protein n=1 Tax=Cytospora mali TaxID=578113 RepID=A0A194V6F6_CYTMA|nr:Acyl carrier protein, mitochondrial [Valsa mali var. pyri (nom. inval.)]